MRFKPGREQNHLRGQGGKRDGAGRPSKRKKEIRKEAAEIARKYLEAHIKPVLAAYGQLAAGKRVRYKDVKTGEIVHLQVDPDPSTTRHYIDKLVPPKEKVDIDLSGSVEIFTNVDVDLGPPKRGSE